MFWPSQDSSLISNVSRVLSFGLFLPFMIYGLFLARSRVQENGRPALILVLLFAAVYTAIHLLSWALIRYRLPVDAVLIPFAGLAVYETGQRLSRRLHPMMA